MNTQKKCISNVEVRGLDRLSCTVTQTGKNWVWVLGFGPRRSQCFLHWGRLAWGRSVLCRASIKSFLWAYRSWVTIASIYKVYHRYSAFFICVTGKSMACAEQETYVHWERTQKHGQGHFRFYGWCLLLNQPSSSMCPETLTPSFMYSLEDISEDWSEVLSRWMETMTGKSKTGIGWLVLWKSLKLSHWDFVICHPKASWFVNLDVLWNLGTKKIFSLVTHILPL